MSAPIYDFEAKTIRGETKKLGEYQGKALLIVNTASECGYTPQYAGLEELHQKYKHLGLMVLGFPCNQFGGQEPGDDAKIAEFCDLRFKISFPLFSKIDVNGNDAHPLFKYLKHEAKGILGTEAIKWNFTKFLVSREGKVLKRFGSNDKPADLSKDIEKALA